MKKLRDLVLALARYLLQRAGEASTYKGALTMLAAYSGWRATQSLDPSSPLVLEAATWGGLFLAGLLNAALPQSLLYAPSRERREDGEPRL